MDPDGQLIPEWEALQQEETGAQWQHMKTTLQFFVTTVNSGGQLVGSTLHDAFALTKWWVMKTFALLFFETMEFNVQHSNGRVWRFAKAKLQPLFLGSALLLVQSAKPAFGKPKWLLELLNTKPKDTDVTVTKTRHFALTSAEAAPTFLDCLVFVSHDTQHDEFAAIIMNSLVDSPQMELPHLILTVSWIGCDTSQILANTNTLSHLFLGTILGQMRLLH